MTHMHGLHNAACHCRAVTFTVRLIGNPAEVSRCSCSLCSMRGAVTASAKIEDLTFLTGEGNLGLYQFHTRTAKHYFCKACGIYTHHRRRSNPAHYGINVACLENVSPFDFREVPVWDGTRHSADTREKDELAGVLRFCPTQTPSAS